MKLPREIREGEAVKFQSVVDSLTQALDASDFSTAFAYDSKRKSLHVFVTV